MHSRIDAAPRLGGKMAIILFVFTLCAFVAESQLTQYVQTTLGYRQPFFLFYVVHSTFWIIFPAHFLYLITTTSHSPSALWRGLSIAITNHLSPQEPTGSLRFPYRKFFRLVLALTVGITYPGLLWFAAVSLASISDVTAIWNTNAFFAYIITVRMFGLKWEPRRLLAVLLATLGVLAVVYGGSTVEDRMSSLREVPPSSPPSPLLGTTTTSIKPTAPLVGVLLTLVASIGYGLYQVLYKKFAALPTDPEVFADRLYDQVPSEDPATGSYGQTRSGSDHTIDPLPFGLHANLLTSIIGLLTFVILWVPIPIFHYLDIEPFVLPQNAKTTFAIAGIALTGVIFNAGFMVLLGLWGPIITSVGNLLTIVLVFFSDMIFGDGLENMTLWSLSGCSVIVAAFSVLAYDMFTQGSLIPN
ncbi:hypothetical protein BDZ94DRAFT_288788 [Collybia nuda]|uniref:EamA domain-containing protein n=1 Tax=Collybia nuda TaxID=64659 RepID=A0A9P5XUI2_9AGAR|nr:hypothetical protein BDZ94DRAFT_288788 [Collybia nuda]